MSLNVLIGKNDYIDENSVNLSQKEQLSIVFQWTIIQIKLRSYIQREKSLILKMAQRGVDKIKYDDNYVAKIRQSNKN